MLLYRKIMCQSACALLRGSSEAISENFRGSYPASLTCVKIILLWRRRRRIIIPGIPGYLHLQSRWDFFLPKAFIYFPRSALPRNHFSCLSILLIRVRTTLMASSLNSLQREKAQGEDPSSLLSPHRSFSWLCPCVSCP
jgi:hypothetical protein